VAATTTDQKDTFATVPGDRRSEVARTLAEPVPQALSLLDQFGSGSQRSAVQKQGEVSKCRRR
jgi:hypothetical protein